MNRLEIRAPKRFRAAHLFSCPGFRTVRAETMREAAQMFAHRFACQQFGKRGYARIWAPEPEDQEAKSCAYSAFIGQIAMSGENPGSTVQFTITRK